MTVNTHVTSPPQATRHKQVRGPCDRRLGSSHAAGRAAMAAVLGAEQRKPPASSTPAIAISSIPTGCCYAVLCMTVGDGASVGRPPTQPAGREPQTHPQLSLDRKDT